MVKNKKQKKYGSSEKIKSDQKNTTYLAKINTLKNDEEYKSYMQTLNVLSNDVWDPIHDRKQVIEPKQMLEDRKRIILTRIKSKISDGEVEPMLLQKRLNLDINKKSKDKILDICKKLKYTLDIVNAKK